MFESGLDTVLVYIDIENWVSLRGLRLFLCHGETVILKILQLTKPSNSGLSPEIMLTSEISTLEYLPQKEAHPIEILIMDKPAS